MLVQINPVSNLYCYMLYAICYVLYAICYVTGILGNIILLGVG